MSSAEKGELLNLTLHAPEISDAMTYFLDHFAEDDAFLSGGERCDASELEVAIAEAEQGLEEGGIPIGAALFDRDGNLLGRGHNRRVQDGDPSVHGETDAFRKAGRQRSYRSTVMVTTLAPCWYCSGLVVQFGIGTVVVGESLNFQGGLEWLRQSGVTVIDLSSKRCIELLGDYIAANPEVWNEDIGEEGESLVDPQSVRPPCVAPP
jgi:creatinine deaminase